MAGLCGSDLYLNSFRKTIQDGLMFHFDSFWPNKYTSSKAFSLVGDAQMLWTSTLAGFSAMTVPINPDGIYKFIYTLANNATIPDPTNQYLLSNAGTICIWVNCNLFQNSAGWTIWKPRGDSNDSGFYVWRISLLGINSNTAQVYSNGASTTYTTNTWTYFCQTWIDDGLGNKTFTLYKDGIIIGSAINTFQSHFSNEPIKINYLNINGSIMQLPIIQLYNRCLSSSEILQNFNAMRKRFKV